MPNLYPTETIEPIQEITETKQPEVKFGRCRKFDFDKGEYVTTPTGKTVILTGMGAYIQWCYKALLTTRYRYLIYSRNYGNEFEDLIGRGLTKSAIESEIKRIASETLMVDPRTASVDNFSFDWREDAVYFTCVVTTVRGETSTIESQAKGVV